MVQAGNASIVHQTVKAAEIFRYVFCGCVDGCVVRDVDLERLHDALELLLREDPYGFLPFGEITTSEEDVVWMVYPLRRRFLAVSYPMP